MTSTKGKEKASAIDLPPTYETSELTTKTFQHDALALPFTIHGSYEDPLFVANEVGGMLGLARTRDSIKDFNETEKVAGSIRSLGGTQECLMLTEKGLYKLLFKSRKNIAIQFQDWVCQVIKEIRLKGKYELESKVNGLLEDNEAYTRKAVEYQAKIEELEKTHEIQERKRARQLRRRELKSQAKETIYVFKDGRNFLKIGMTTNDPKERLRNHRSTMPNLQVLGEFRCINARLIEKTVHFILDFQYVDGEHFDIEYDQVEKVINDTISFIDNGHRFDFDEQLYKSRVDEIVRYIDDCDHVIENLPSNLDEEENDEWSKYRKMYIVQGSSTSYIQWHDLREHFRTWYNVNNPSKLAERPNHVKAYFNKKIEGGFQKRKIGGVTVNGYIGVILEVP